jgi:hypothetical protein
MIDPLCPKCEQKVKEEKPPLVVPKISLGFVYHLALELQFSFQAIALLADFAITRKASSMHIRLDKINDEENNNLSEQEYD